MVDAAAKLLEALRARAGRRRRLDLDAIWGAFTDACPHLTGRAAVRLELRQALDALAAAGALRLPRDERRFDAVQRPPLPRWIELAPPDPGEDVRALARGTAWHPALAFVTGLRTLSRSELEALRAVQRFLAALGATDPVLTVRERSLLLFGDEKRLEALARGRLFGPGRLSYELLRAREVHPPFVHRDLGHGDVALILENKDTFCSAVAAGASLGAAARVRWVIYGGGNAILQTWPSMTEWAARPARALYFGDLDTDGLEILWQLGARREQWPELPPVAPCEALYRRLIARAAPLGLALAGRPCDPERAARLAGLFGGPVRTEAARLLERGGRWPQEAVTERDLREVLSEPTAG
jgi:hypothetical protein